MKILQLELARARHVSERKLSEIWDNPDWDLELKMNGWRFALHFGGGLERPHMTGRRVSSKTGLFSEKAECARCLWPLLQIPRRDYTVIDGEIMPPEGGNFHDMASIMNSDPETALETIQRIGPPSYHVFDVLFWKGQDVREECLLQRRILLKQILDTERHPHWYAVAAAQPRRSTYEEIVKSGEEGVILKRGDSAYGESGSWIKCKRETTLDVVITGFTEARHGRTGKYDGLIGAVVCSVRSVTGEWLEVAQVSGMDDELRKDMTARREDFLGTACEIAAQEFGQDRLLHPRWRRHKPEANPADCTFKKMQEDLEASGTKRAVANAPREQLKLF